MNELRGKPVVNQLNEDFSKDILILKSKGIIPKLTVVRVGESEDDISYERGILKRFSKVNAEVNVIELPQDVAQEKLEKVIKDLNEDDTVHGILVFRPLPKHLSEDRLKTLIATEKDVDCMGLSNMALVFSGDKNGYPPCTPQAVVELLDFYDLDLTGKKVTIVGRSMVVGKPLAMLLLGKNATVTICHTRTKNIADECKKADILVACAGVPKMITADYVQEDQIVVDVGINVLEGKLCGDVDYEAVSNKVKMITPVPGGVGSITTSVLLMHTIKSAMTKI